ncbi:MAG TPA: PHB depolymerase family esterase [Gemmataceae bacterium]|nr:PHB depolymerase family esterase [Gemmataceae bacterium]
MHVPPVAGPMPLVVMLHGAGGSAEFAVEETGWSRLAEQEGFAVAYPEGLPVRADQVPKFLTNPQEWTDGSGRGGADDAGFLLAVLEDARSRVPIVPGRVYLTGFSNGAGMAFRFAAEQADRVAAIAPVAGHLWVADPKPSRPVPTIYMVGDADPLVPLAGGTARTPWGKLGNRPAVADSLERWSRAIGSPPGSDRFPVRVIPGHGHHWPGGKALMGERLGGPASNEVDATAEIWRFFQSIQASGGP